MYMYSLWQRLVFWFLALLIGSASVLTAAPVHAAPPAQDYTYEECSRADEVSVQAEMEAIALGMLSTASSGLDIDGLVERKWNELGVGTTFDQAVDAALLSVQQETGYWERFVSGWSATQAEALANQVAVKAFTSPAFQNKIEELSTALAQSMVLEMQAHAARSASSALLCLQSYVGERYSATLYTAFEQRIGQEVTSLPALDETGAPITVAPVDLHLKALGGVGVIVAAQVTRRIALALTEKISGRLAGKVAGRVLGRLGSSVIPYIGWLVGAGLIVWDLVEGSQGALPQIRSALQAEEVKQEVRSEIAVAVREGLESEIHTLAATLAATLVEEWQGFCGAHGDLCALAAANTLFRTFLAATPVDQLDRLNRQAAIFVAELDPGQLDTSLADGTFAALLTLPESALDLLRRTRSPQTVLAWAELAGPALDRVVAAELYRWTTPGQLTPATFSWLVAIEDNDIIHNLLALESANLAALTRLPVADVQAVVATLSADDVTWLAGYLAGQPGADAQTTLAQLTSGATTIAALQAPPKPVAIPVQAGELSVEAVPAVEAAPGVGPVVGPSVWTSPNGVLVAAAMLLLFLLGFGVFVSLRGDSNGRPS